MEGRWRCFLRVSLGNSYLQLIDILSISGVLHYSPPRVSLRLVLLPSFHPSSAAKALDMSRSFSALKITSSILFRLALPTLQTSNQDSNPLLAIHMPSKIIPCTNTTASPQKLLYFPSTQHRTPGSETALAPLSVEQHRPSPSS